MLLDVIGLLGRPWPNVFERWKTPTPLEQSLRLADSRPSKHLHFIRRLLRQYKCLSEEKPLRVLGHEFCSAGVYCQYSIAVNLVQAQYAYFQE